VTRLDVEKYLFIDNGCKVSELYSKLRFLMVSVLLLALQSWGCSNSHSDVAQQSYRTDPTVLPDITFVQSSNSVEVYDFLEVTLNVEQPSVRNPFTDVFVHAKFSRSGNEQVNDLAVQGFCDSDDGSIFRVRFMPTEPGEYKYTVSYWQDNLQKVYSGRFKAVDVSRRGVVHVDPAYPWHFLWSGTGEHYYLNGTTAFLLMGWDDEKTIREILDRFHSLDINRIRVLLDGRTDHFWTEPIKPGSGFQSHVNPWMAKRSNDITNPGFDYARFNVDYWRKFERMLTYARERDTIISIIFGWNDTLVHPQAGSADERRYMQYAVTRLGSYSNITWDLGDDLDWFRSEAWTHETGIWLQEIDPYQHLATSHPTKNHHQDRSSSWFGMTSFQMWERPMHAWMLKQREQQVSTGRIIPQVNEEYGYEDHYPQWAPYKPPAASADAMRRVAWEIAMVGGYQVTGETAKRGTGMGPDTGGGWVNGRGDETMTMLTGYAHMVHFFSSFQWWKTDPHDELVNDGSFCLAEPGRLYVIYLPRGGRATVKLEPGRYEMKWFNPRSGEYSANATAEGPDWTSSVSPDREDWVIQLIRSLSEH
jgi:hypothetical protein